MGINFDQILELWLCNTEAAEEQVATVDLTMLDRTGQIWIRLIQATLHLTKGERVDALATSLRQEASEQIIDTAVAWACALTAMQYRIDHNTQEAARICQLEILPRMSGAPHILKIMLMIVSARCILAIGDTTSFVKIMHDAKSEARHLRNPTCIAATLIYSAIGSLEYANFSDAVREVDEAIALGERHGLSNFQKLGTWVKIHILISANRHEEAARICAAHMHRFPIEPLKYGSAQILGQINPLTNMALSIHCLSGKSPYRPIVNGMVEHMEALLAQSRNGEKRVEDTVFTNYALAKARLSRLTNDKVAVREAILCLHEACYLKPRRLRMVRLRWELFLCHVDLGEWKEATVAAQEHMESKRGLMDTASIYNIALESERKQRIEAERLEQAKAIFLSNISHEVRTPLNSIFSMSHSALLRESSPTHRHRHIQIQSAIKSLLGMLVGILDDSGLTAGSIVIASKTFSLDSLIDGIANLSGGFPWKSEVEFSIELAPDLPKQLIGDEPRLTQVLINLIHNSAKFTRQGEVSLRISAERARADEVLMTFSVSDTGTGINPEQVERLFKPFSPGIPSSQDYPTGSGLGLSIASKLVALMGGALEVSTEEGRGTSFSFSLHFPVGQPSHPLEVTVACTALIYDQRTSVCTTLATLFRQNGATALIANSPAHLVELCWQPLPQPNSPTMIVCSDSLILDLCRRDHPEARNILLVHLSRQPTTYRGCDANLLSPPTALSVRRMLTELFCTRSTAVDAYAPLALAAHKYIVIDDDEIASQALGAALRASGAEVEVHTSAHSAIGVLLSTPSEMWSGVLTDIHLPELTGIEAIRVIRAIDRFSRLQIFALSASSAPSDEIDALAAGASNFFLKPVDFSQLISIACKACSPASQNVVGTRLPASFNINAALRFSGGSVQGLKNLISVFRQATPKRLASLRTAVAGSRSELRRKAHALRGASLYIGADRAAVKILFLERISTTADANVIYSLIDLVEADLLELLNTPDVINLN